MLAQTSHWNGKRKPDLLNRNKNRHWWREKREISDGYMAYLSTEWTSATTQNRSSRERVKDSFTRLIHSRHCHFIHIYVYMYVCIYNFLWIILIPSLWSVLLEVRLQSLAKISWFLCHCEIIKVILSKLEAVVCESYGWVFAWSPLGHYLRELLVKKWYKAYILPS